MNNEQCTYFSGVSNRLGVVVDSVIAAFAIERGFEPTTMKYIGSHMYSFSAKHVALWSKNKDWLARNHYCVRVERHFV
jgi:hypothetical protein